MNLETNMNLETKDKNKKIDQLEEAMQSQPRVECPVVHRFTPGIYIREITIPAGTLLTSMEHLTTHPFVISKGRIWVSSENEGSVVYEAPHTGITIPGTRRALYAETETVWTTFHATDLTDVEEIGKAILAPPSNPLLLPDHTPAWKDSLPLKLEAPRN
jgi:hypothetical protein